MGFGTRSGSRRAPKPGDNRGEVGGGQRVTLLEQVKRPPAFGQITPGRTDARTLARRQIGHQVSGSHSFVGLRMALHLFDAARSSRPHPERIEHRGNQRRARESEQRPTAVDVDRDSERDDDTAPGV